MRMVPAPVLVNRPPCEPPPLVRIAAEPPAVPMVRMTPASMSKVPVLAADAPVKVVAYLLETLALVVLAVTWNVPPLNQTAPDRPARLAELPEAITPPEIVVTPE